MTESQTQVPIPEEVQLWIRLESIFMPHLKKARDKLYKNEPSETDQRFVHYTSADNALKIIESKRLWMRNATCMSDYREVQHGFDMLAKFFSPDSPGLAAFCEALNACAPGAAQEAINLFNQWWNNIRFHTYIASISEHKSKENEHGRLSMWRAVGNNAARVALVIKIPRFSGAADALNLMFSPVAYLTDHEVPEVMDDVIKNIWSNLNFLRSIDRQIVIRTVFTMIRAGVTCLKHEGFREEREWRAIYSPKLNPSPLMKASTEVIAGVPQVVYKVPLDVAVSDALADLDLSRMFDRLIIGPSPYPLVMYEAFTEALKKAGVEEAESRVFTSCIPIRS
jgi:hypothetical protein